MFGNAVPDQVQIIFFKIDNFISGAVLDVGISYIPLDVPWGALRLIYREFLSPLFPSSFDKWGRVFPSGATRRSQWVALALRGPLIYQSILLD
jgi:hypothetical protein